MADPVIDPGVKEILELINGVKVLAVAGKAILKDGKVGISDLPILMSLISNQKDLVDAFTGLGDIPLEAKHLTIDEITQIINALINSAKEVQAA